MLLISLCLNGCCSELYDYPESRDVLLMEFMEDFEDQDDDDFLLLVELKKVAWCGVSTY